MKKFIYDHPISLSVIWVVFIFVLCATPGQYIPSADWLELLSFDKFVHACMFFILSSLLFLIAIKNKQSNSAIGIYFLGCVLYGALLEVMQANYFSNRSSDWKDIVANTIGCIVGLLFLKKSRKMYLKYRETI